MDKNIYFGHTCNITITHNHLHVFYKEAQINIYSYKNNYL